MRRVYIDIYPLLPELQHRFRDQILEKRSAVYRFYFHTVVPSIETFFQKFVEKSVK